MTVPLLRDVESQAPQAICELQTTNVALSLLVNGTVPPFDNAAIRRAMALGLDGKGFIDILSERQDRIGGLMLTPPEGGWGCPPRSWQHCPVTPPMSKIAGRNRGDS